MEKGKLMEGFVRWLRRYVLPWAGQIGRIGWLTALRDAFVSTLPINIAGSIAVLIVSLVRAAGTQLHWTAFVFAMSPLVGIANIVWQGTFKLFALFFAFAWGYQLAKTYEVPALPAATVAVASFAMSIANLTKIKVGGQLITIKHAFNINQLSTTGLFTAILFGGLGTLIFILAWKGKLQIHFRSQLPRAEYYAFASLPGALIAIGSVGVVNYLFQIITGDYFGDWLLKSIQAPLVKLGQGFGPVLLITFLVQVLWFFGLNGGSVLAPVIESIWLTPENINVMAAKNGQAVPYAWTRNSFDVFVWFGGAGGTLVLVIAILCLSKRTDFRSLAKIALAPSVFNINEPVMFGLPIILNTAYVIPFIFAPLVNVTIAYWATQLGWVNPVQIVVPAVMPPILNSFLATNYDWRAIVLTIVNMAVAFVIWLPFVIAADKLADQEQTDADGLHF
jgi:PTS system cellobiose-specific IIC component